MKSYVPLAGRLGLVGMDRVPLLKMNPVKPVPLLMLVKLVGAIVGVRLTVQSDPVVPGELTVPVGTQSVTSAEVSLRDTSE